MSLLEDVLRELGWLRRQRDGATAGTLLSCPHLLGLLGMGDPLVAYNRLKASVLGMPWSVAVEAASYSLALSSARDTHLARLENFGTDYAMDQRQARRYSDTGLREIAAYIQMHATVESNPHLTISILATPLGTLEFLIHTQCPSEVEMRSPLVEAEFANNERRVLDINWDPVRDGSKTAHVQCSHLDVSDVSLSWRGELFPMFTVTDTSSPSDSLIGSVTTLGSRLTLKLRPRV